MKVHREGMPHDSDGGLRSYVASSQGKPETTDKSSEARSKKGKTFLQISEEKRFYHHITLGRCVLKL